MPLKLIPIAVSPIEARMKGQPVNRNLIMSMQYTVGNSPVVRRMDNITAGQYMDFHDYMNYMGLHYIDDELGAGLNPYFSEAERKASHNQIFNEFIEDFARIGRQIIPFDTPTLFEMAKEITESSDKFLMRVRKLLNNKHAKKYIDVTKQIVSINDKLYAYSDQISTLDKQMGELKSEFYACLDVDKKKELAEKHNMLAECRNQFCDEYNRLLVEVYNDRVKTQTKLAQKVCEYIDPKGQIQFKDIFGNVAKPVRPSQVDKYYAAKKKAK